MALFYMAGMMCLPKDIGCQIKSPVPGVGYLPSCSSVMGDGGSQRLSKQCSLLPLLMAAHQNLMVQHTLLLKTSHTLITGFGEIELVLSRKFPPCRLVITELEVLRARKPESYREDQPGKSDTSVLQQPRGG